MLSVLSLILEQFQRKVLFFIFQRCQFVLLQNVPRQWTSSSTIFSNSFLTVTSEAVCQAVELATAMHANGDDACPVPAYTDDNVSIKVIKLIQSYVGIINKMVWRKS